MSGVGYGDHGLVDPDGIPGADLDLAVVSSGAGTIKSGGQSMKTVADDLPAKWQRLSGVYESPESEQVFALMDPVTDDVHTIGTVARKVASALETYASAAADPKRKLDELRVEAAAFVAEVQHGITRPKQVPIPKTAAEWDAYDPGKYEGQTEHVAWYDDPGTTLQNNNLIREINEQVALLQAAQADCALAIKKASGASVKKAFTAPTESDLNEHGIDLPWSRVGTAKGKNWAEQFEEGFKDDFLKTVMGVAHLAGWDNSGDWSWGTLGSAWKGFGDGAVAFTLLVNPMAWAWGALDPDGLAGRTQRNALEGAAAWAKKLPTESGIAAGAAASVVGSSLVGPGGWAGRAGRAEELASGLGKLGAKDLGRSVERWAADSGNAEHIDALADILDDARRAWDRDAHVDSSPFTDRAFRELWDERVEDYQLANPDFHRDQIESKDFVDQGGVRGYENPSDPYGPHTRQRHIRTGASGPALDAELSSRAQPPKPPMRHSVFTGTEDEVNGLVAQTLDYRHEAVQRWLDDVRHGRVPLKRGATFDLPVDRSIGRGWDPKSGFYDGRSVRVVLKYDPTYPSGYRVQTAFPQD
ncbi:hypothetical protein SAMN05660766_2446 [Curtobacterium sp. 314Chir4.1]|uniref:RNase A-like domain-containing protein n=1 Tax=Curtobacterium sp. 314Chir4.1 TaxID=1279028 RepID=UPI000BCF3E08|nr:RNase A-like domain-containing protein [Curtobacterium sp. 314Chir4.1]SOC88734.1 hypothetical protein SAMN05660766_2446 [Curtobacterium sp. 314Chir4.1]